MVVLVPGTRSGMRHSTSPRTPVLSQIASKKLKVRTFFDSFPPAMHSFLYFIQII